MRWPNLLMIFFVQLLIRFSIIEWLEIPHFLNGWQFLLSTLCSILPAAGGYIINDLYDLETDTINKPERITIGKHISVRRAWSLYFYLNALAIGIGYYLANLIRMNSLWLIPVVGGAILYLYAADLKKRAIIGNVIVSLLTALPVFLVAVYDLIPALSMQNVSQTRPFILVVCGYALFAFWLNLMREIVKDAEDIGGDEKSGYKTLAVLLGPIQIRYVLFLLLVVLLSFTGTFNYMVAVNNDWLSAAYIFVAINFPLVYFGTRLYRAEQSSDYTFLSKFLKWIMLLGILSMLVFTISIKIGG